MVGIISEYKYSNEELIKLRKQGCVVNYTLMPQTYANYSEELTKINNRLIARSSALIFRIETFFSGTKEAIERALYFKKKCKIIYEGKEYILQTLDDWKVTTGYGSNAVTYKHILLQTYEDQRRNYFEQQQAKKLAAQYDIALEGVEESEEEVYRLVNQFKHLYDIQVDMDSKREVYLAYKSIAYYLEHDIEYSNEPTSTDDEFPFEIVSFGNLDYLEDYIYKNQMDEVYE